VLRPKRVTRSVHHVAPIYSRVPIPASRPIGPPSAGHPAEPPCSSVMVKGVLRRFLSAIAGGLAYLAGVRICPRRVGKRGTVAQKWFGGPEGGQEMTPLTKWPHPAILT